MVKKLFFLVLVVLLVPLCSAKVKSVEFELRRCDGGTGAVKITKEKIEPSKVGVVVIDMWNYQGCVTIVGRIGAMIERMNKSAGAARELRAHVYLGARGEVHRVHTLADHRDS